MEKTNQTTLTVSQVSQSIKRTVEDNYSYVRVRGELSGTKRAASGHIYFNLKDDNAVLNGICWKGVAANVTFDMEDGLEVICVGKITTYPGRSNYQIVIDSIEIAGEGALMALLEKRKKQFATEGLFDESRKQPLPFMPQIIGVVTSSTGAVIRDILHRIEERFPVRVIIWPVLVQGDGAKEQIAQAIDGFNHLSEHDEVPRPDLLIVARGGGSLEDLWAFNEEIVVRAAANSKIPLISAVGHETDTTLIDYVSDRRAPTPTGAAEIAVPVRAEWIATVLDYAGRLYGAVSRFLDDRYVLVQARAGGLITPKQMMENITQRLDDWVGRFYDTAPNLFAQKQHKIQILAGKIISPVQKLETMSEQLKGWVGRLRPTKILHEIEMMEQKLSTQAQLLESYHYKKVLARGFALVRSQQDGQLVTSASSALDNMVIEIEFSDGIKKAKIGKSEKKNLSKRNTEDNQGNLF